MNFSDQNFTCAVQQKIIFYMYYILKQNTLNKINLYILVPKKMVLHEVFKMHVFQLIALSKYPYVKGTIMIKLKFSESIIAMEMNS